MTPSHRGFYQVLILVKFAEHSSKGVERQDRRIPMSCDPFFLSHGGGCIDDHRCVRIVDKISDCVTKHFLLFLALSVTILMVALKIFSLISSCW